MSLFVRYAPVILGGSGGGGGGSGANTALSNLAAVAINDSLLPGVDNTIAVGSTTKSFASANIQSLNDASGNASISVYDRVLLGTNGVSGTYVDYGAGVLYDTIADKSIDYGARLLVANNTVTQLTWTASGVSIPIQATVGHGSVTAPIAPFAGPSIYLTQSVANDSGVQIHVENGGNLIDAEFGAYADSGAANAWVGTDSPLAPFQIYAGGSAALFAQPNNQTQIYGEPNQGDSGPLINTGAALTIFTKSSGSAQSYSLVGAHGTSGSPIFYSIDTAGNAAFTSVLLASDPSSPLEAATMQYVDNNIRYFDFGDGSDGAAVMDGTNTFAWASLSGSVYTLLRTVYLTDLTINSGITLISPTYAIFGNGTLANSGTISVAGQAGGLSGIPANPGIGGGYWGISGTPLTRFDFQGGADGANGVPGAVTAGAPGSVNPQSVDNMLGVGGGASGAGGSGTSGAGGASSAGNNPNDPGFAFYIRHTAPIYNNVDGVLANGAGSASGGAGAGDGVNNGGDGAGGGGNGGLMQIFFATISPAGTFTAAGGNGGAGGNTSAGNTGGGGGGGGGAGGLIFILTNGTIIDATVLVNGGNGGAGGTGFGTGTAGTAGTAGTNGLALIYSTSYGGYI